MKIGSQIQKVCGLLPGSFIAVFLFGTSINAQQCDSNFFAVRISGHINTVFAASCVNSQDELLAVNQLPYHNSSLMKLTSQGNLIWSTAYTGAYFVYNTYFRNLEFKSVVAGPDSSYFVSGATHAGGGTIAILANIDKYGRVLWSKIYGTLDDFPHLMLTRSGKLIAYSYSNKNPKILCLSLNGAIEWITVLKDQSFKIIPGMKPAITQLRNGNIAIADALHKTGTNSKESDFHFFSLDAENGSIKWESSFEYPSADPDFVPQLNQLTELPNGSLSLITSLDVKTMLNPEPTRRILNFLLNASGDHTGTFAYYVPNTSCNAADVAAAGDGSRVIFGNMDGRPALFKIEADNEIRWSKGYARAPGSFVPTLLSKAKSGYDMLLSNIDSKSVQLLFTDPAGRLDCAATDAQFIKEEVPWAYNSYSIQSNVSGNDNELLYVRSYALTAENYVQNKITDCQYLGDCCTDVIDSMHTKEINICEGSSFKFPDNSSTSDSGLYYITHKTGKGCDSVQFFNIHILKNPADLRVTADTCFAENDSLVLKATEGFQQYHWMNQTGSASSFTIYQEGTYFVTVNNLCGSRTDSIHAYRKCEYEILLPNAFTPNNDGKNDFFRIPPQNKNRLLNFRIYNRWGQCVFYTTNISSGWDGKFNKQPEPVGAYIYYIEMSGLNGRRFKQSGSFVLIR